MLTLLSPDLLLLQQHGQEAYGEKWLVNAIRAYKYFMTAWRESAAQPMCKEPDFRLVLILQATRARLRKMLQSVLAMRLPRSRRWSPENGSHTMCPLLEHFGCTMTGWMMRSLLRLGVSSMCLIMSHVCLQLADSRHAFALMSK